MRKSKVAGTVEPRTRRRSAFPRRGVVVRGPEVREALVGGRGRAFATVGVAALLAAACGAGDRAASGPVVRDSAGITIVENAAPLWADGEGWRVAPEPIVDIGVLDGAPEYQLFRVRGAARLPDGRIVVVNGGTHELRFYDPAGRFLRAVGKEGEGPGEFRSAGGLFVGADSLYIHDFRLDRISVFDVRGEFARVFRLSPGAGGGIGWVIDRFGDGSLLVRGTRVFQAGEEKTGVYADTLPHYRYGRNGEILDTIGRWPMAEQYVWTDGRSMGVSPAPFGKPSVMAAHEGALFFGPGDRFEIGRYAADGRLDRLIRRDAPPLRVTPEDIERYKEERLAAASEGYRNMLQRMLPDMPFPDVMPAYRAFEVDAAGRLWVEAFRRPGDDVPRWSVFDPEGRWLGDVETPVGLRIFEIGDDYVLGVWQDEFEVEHVRLHRLEKAAGDGRAGVAGDGP